MQSTTSSKKISSSAEPKAATITSRPRPTVHFEEDAESSALDDDDYTPPPTRHVPNNIATASSQILRKIPQNSPDNTKSASSLVDKQASSPTKQL